MKRAVIAFMLGLLALASGCTVGPRYSRPAAPAPAPDAWKTQPPWQQAAPKDAIPKGEWWKVFNDPELNGLEQQLLQSNQSLLAARDRLEQARSLARVATSPLFPQVSADPSAVRERGSANRPLNGAVPVVINGVNTTVQPYTQSVYTVPFDINYEVDIFGRVRRNVEAANATLQSTAADLQNAQLVLTAELAADYFSLRELDAEFNVVKESVAYQRKGLDLVNRRHAGGVASGLEVAQQAALLDSTLSQLSLVQQSRAQYEHAIAVLVGQPASSASVRVAPLQATPPPVPLGVPSDVLQRRPDIASAERQMAYQNAQVGIARAAFYPANHSQWLRRLAKHRNRPTIKCSQPFLVVGCGRFATARSGWAQSRQFGCSSCRLRSVRGKLPGGRVDRFSAGRGRYQQSQHALASIDHPRCSRGGRPPRSGHRQ